MSTGAIDYAALARQAGATSSTPPTVDYAALAKRAGATGYQPPAQAQQPEQKPEAPPTYPDPEGGIAAAEAMPGLKLEHVTQALPIAGGIVGAGLGNAPGMIIGSGVGRLGQQMINARFGSGAVPATPGAAAADVGGEMAVSALSAGGAKLAQKLAPRLAEAALGTRFSERMYGRNPGAAILDNTRGMAPDAVAASARQTSRALMTDLESKAANAGANGVTASTKPALDILDNEIATATRENNADLVKQLMDARKQLTIRFDTGQAIPQDLSPVELLDLKRGLGDTITNWNRVPERQGVSGVLKRAYHALDSEFDKAVPGAADSNQIVSTLIGVTRDAERRKLMPSLVQNIAGRVAAHTGALTLGAIGGAEGYRQGGWGGGVVGGLAGLVAPELAARPGAQLFGARALGATGRYGAVPLSTLLTGLYSDK